MIFIITHRWPVIIGSFALGLAGFIGWKLLDWDEVKW